MRKELKYLGCISEDDEISFDGTENTNLKDFIMSFPYVYYKSGIWNDYEKRSPQSAIKSCNNSLYGGNITLGYDEKWEAGEVDGKADIYIACPCESDMW